jgi:hypothetical protein
MEMFGSVIGLGILDWACCETKKQIDNKALRKGFLFRVGVRDGNGMRPLRFAKKRDSCSSTPSSPLFNRQDGSCR